MRWVPLALLATACSSEVAGPLRLDVPIEADHRAAVIALEREGKIEAHAQALTGGKLDPLVAPLDGEPVVTVLLYTETLEELFIAPGRLTSAANGAMLPEADVELSAQPGRSDTWSLGQPRSAALLDYRFEGGQACRRFADEDLSLPDGRATWALGVPGHGVLVQTDHHALHLYKPDRSRVLLSATSTTYAAMLTEDGTIWLGGESGVIWSGTIEDDTLELEPTLAVPTFYSIKTLDGDPAGDLFIQDDGRRLFHYDGTAWTQIDQVFDRGRGVGVKRIAEKTVLSMWADCLCVLRYVDGVRQEIPVPGNSFASNGVSTIIWDPPLGFVAGSYIGEVFLSASPTADAWSKVEGTLGIKAITSFLKHGNSYFYSDRRGGVVEYIRDRGFCESTTFGETTDRDTYLAVYGDDLILAADRVFWRRALP
jgi:hypothetical protein